MAGPQILTTFVWSVGLASPGPSALLSDGSAVTLAYVNQGDAGYAVVGQRFDAQGNTLGTPVTVASASNLNLYSQGLTLSALPGGGYAVVLPYARTYPNQAAYAWQGVTASGSLILPKPEFIESGAPVTPVQTATPVLLPAAGGALAEFYTQALSNGQIALMRRSYQLDGTAGAAINVTPVKTATIYGFTAVPLSGGNTMVVVVANPHGTDISNLQAEVLDGNGAPAGGVTPLDRKNSWQNVQASPDQNGHAVVSWLTNDYSTGLSFNYVPVGQGGKLAPVHTMKTQLVAGYPYEFAAAAVLSDGTFLMNEVMNTAAGFSANAEVFGSGARFPVAPGVGFTCVGLGGDVVQFTYNDTHGNLITETVQYESAPVRKGAHD